MGDSIENWLKTEVRINCNIHNFEKDFSNGYYFGAIFFNYGLNPKFIDVFQNKHQGPHILRNFYYLPELFKRISVPFNEDIMRSIQKCELGHAKQLLFKMRDALSTYEFAPNVNDKVKMTLGTQNIDQRCKSKGMAMKNVCVEKGLVAFENEFLRQKEIARNKKDLDDAKYKQVISDLRQNALEKSRKNKQYCEEWDQLHKEKWLDTIAENQKQVEKREKLESHLTHRIVAKENRIKSSARLEALGNGINKFEQNALRLGVELHKDPENIQTKQKDKFNAVASMQKIRNRVAITEHARTEKEKRQRRLRIEESRAREVYKDINEEETLLSRYKGMSEKYVVKGLNNLIEDQFTEMILENRAEHAHTLQVQTFENAQKIADKLGHTTKEEYHATKKEAEEKLRYFLLEERENAYKKHYDKCWDVVGYITDMAERTYHRLGGNISNQIEGDFWRDLQEKFMNNEPLFEETVASTIFNTKKMDKKGTVAPKEMNLKQALHLFETYMKGDNRFKMPFKYDLFLEPQETQRLPEFYLDNIVKDIIDLQHPIVPKNEFPTKNINYLPLRISIIGTEFSGKKFLANCFKKNFGLEVIVLEEVLAEVEALCKSDEMTQDSKLTMLKKARDKKRNQKTTKVANDSVVETEGGASVQQSEFKEIGEKIMICKQNEEEIPNEYLVELIIKKLASLFPTSTKKGVAEAYFKAKDDLYNHQQSVMDEGSVVPSKKGDAPKKGKKTETQAEVKVLLDTKKYFYSAGFVLVDFPKNMEQAELFDQMLTGFVPQNERLNTQAESMKETARRLLNIEDLPNEVDAYPSLDIILRLNVSEDKIKERAGDRKRDPTTGDIYHMVLNPPHEGDKKLMDRLEDIEVDMNEVGMNYYRKNQLFDELNYYYEQFGLLPDIGHNKSRENLGNTLKPVQVIDNNDIPEEELMEFMQSKIQEVQDVKYTYYNRFGDSNEIMASNMMTVDEEPNLNHNESIEQKNFSKKASEFDMSQEERIKSSKTRKSETEQGANNISLIALNSIDVNRIDPKAIHMEDDGPMHVHHKVGKGKYGEDKCQNTQSKIRGVQQLMASVKSVNMMSRYDQTLKKASLNWEQIPDCFMTALDRELAGASMQLVAFKTSLTDIQRQFAKNFERQSDTSYLLIKFIENYGRFANDQPSLLSKQFTKDQLMKKIDVLHDQVWEIIQRQKDVALQEKENITQAGWINKEIDKLTQCFLRFVGCEQNNIHFKRLMLQSYYSLCYERPESEIGYEVEDINLDPNNLPQIDYEEYVPLERIESIINCFEIYKDSNLIQIRQNAHRIPKDMATCLIQELENSEKRFTQTRVFITNKIKKLKIRYSCFLHRLEDWIVHSIKTENTFIYELMQKIRDSVTDEIPQIEFHLKFFDPLTDYNVIQFDVGPRQLVLPLEESFPDDHFNCSQLYFLFTDLSNLQPKFVSHDMSEKTAFELTFLQHHFSFRIKNNKIGLIPMFPNQWTTFSKSRLEKILGFTADPETKYVDLADIALMLTLWRYPTPTQEDLTKYSEALNKASQETELNFDVFLKVPCWLDEWDESLVPELERETVYNTGYIKQFLFWAYNFEMDDEFNIDAYLKCQNLFINKTGSLRLFKDIFVNNYLY